MFFHNYFIVTYFWEGNTLNIFTIKIYYRSTLIFLSKIMPFVPASLVEN